jgi:hypothetical protein
MTEQKWAVGDIAIAENTDTGETFPVVFSRIGLSQTWFSPHGKRVDRGHSFTRAGELDAPSIPEPQGLGAVVQIEDRVPMIRTGSEGPCQWSDCAGGTYAWEHILELGTPRILSTGVLA